MPSALPAGTFGPAFTRGRIARLLSVGALALAGLTCRDSSPLGPGLPQAARLSVTPNFQTVAGGPVVTLTDVVVKVFRLPRSADATPIIDTIAPFVNDTVRLSLSVEIIGTNNFEVRITARAGTDTVYQGTDSVSAHVTTSGGGTAPPPAEIDLHWASADTLVTSLRVDPRDTIITVGDDVPFRTTARRADNSIATGVYIGWRSTNPSLTIDQATGVARATAEFADATVIATMGSGLADTTHLSATRRVGSVVASPDVVTLGVGSTLQMTAVVSATDGTPLPTRPVNWIALNTSVATVSNTGFVTAVTAGSTSIIVSSDNKADTVAVTVSRKIPTIAWGRPADISYPTALGPAQLNATATFAGAAVAGTFTYTPTAGTVLNAGADQPLSLTFVPSDAVTYQNATGTQAITVLKGVATLALSNLTHTYDGTPKSATVASTPASLSGVVVTYQPSGGAVTTTPPTAAGSYAVQATLTHTNYQATAANGVLTISAASQSIALTPIPDKTFGTPPFAVTATATSGLAVSFGATGACSVAGSTVTLESEGTCVISAMQPGDGNWAPATVVADTFNVLPAPVASVDVQPDTSMVQVGQSVMLSAILRDAGNRVLSGRTITWTTGDAAIATVNAQTGEVFGVAPGSVQIFATSESVIDAGIVIVQAPPPSVTATVLPTDIDTLFAIGATRQYAVRSFNGEEQVAGVYSWRSTNTGVATVNSSFGIVTAVAPGSAQLIVEEQGGTADTMTVVVDPRLAQIVLSPTRRMLFVGDTTRFTVTGADALGNPMPLPGSVEWSQFDGSYAASVDADGLVRGENIGYSTVAARVTLGNEFLEARSLVEVVRRVAHVDVSPAAVRLNAFGQMATFNAVAIGHDGNPVAGATINWESVNASVAIIADGISGGSTTVKSVRNGVTMVRAWSEGVAGEQALVVQQEVATLTVSPDPITVDIGGYAPMTAIARDATGNVIPLAPGAVAWTSANGTVAEIGVATGVAKGLARGTSVITAMAGVTTTATIVVQDIAVGQISFAVDTLTVLSGDTVDIDVRLNKSPPGQLTVSFVVEGGNAAFSPTSVTFNNVQTSQRVRLVGRFSGEVAAVASTADETFLPDTLRLFVRSGVWFENSAPNAMNAGEEITTRLRISEPAPAGGLMVRFEGSGPVVRVTPDPVLIPFGHLAADVVVRATGAGVATVTPVVSGIRGAPLVAEVYPADLTIADPDTIRTIGVGQYEWGTPTNDGYGGGEECAECYIGGGLTRTDGYSASRAGNDASSSSSGVGTLEIPGSPGSWVDYENDYLCGYNYGYGDGYGQAEMAGTPPSEIIIRPILYQADYCVRIGTSPLADLPLSVRSSDVGTLAVEENTIIRAGSNSIGFAVHGRRPGDVTVTASAVGWTPASIPVRVTTPRLWFQNEGDTITVSSANIDADFMVGDSLKRPHPRVNSMYVRLTSSNPAVLRIDTTGLVEAGTYYGYAYVNPVAVGSGTAWLRLSAEGHIGDSILVRVPEREFVIDPVITVGTNLLYSHSFWFTREPSDSLFITVTPIGTDSSSVAADTGFWYRPPYYGYAALQVRGYSLGSRQLVLSAPGYADDTVTVNVVTPNFIAGPYEVLAGTATSVAVYTGVGGIGMVPFADLTVSVTRVGTDTSATAPASFVIPALNGFGYLDLTGNSAGTSQLLLQATGFADTIATVNVGRQRLAAQTQFCYYEGYCFDNVATYFSIGYLQQEQGANRVRVHLPQLQTADKVLQVASLQGRAVPTSSQVIVTAGSYASNFFGWNGVTVGTDTIVVSDPSGTFDPDSFFVDVSAGALAVQPESEMIIQRDQSPTTAFSGYYRSASDLQQRLLSDTAGFTVELESSDPAVLTVERFVRAAAYNGTFSFNATYVGDGVAYVIARDSAGRPEIAGDTSARITMSGPRLMFSTPSYSLGMNQTSAPLPGYGAGVTVQVSNTLSADQVVYLTSTDPRVLQVPDSIVLTAASPIAVVAATSMDTVGVVLVEATAPGYASTVMEFDVGRGRVELYTYNYLETNETPAAVQVSITDQYGTNHPSTRAVTLRLTSSNASVAFVDSAQITIDSGGYQSTGTLMFPLDRGRTNIVASETGYPAMPRYRPDTVEVEIAYPALWVSSYPQVGMAQVDSFQINLPQADSSDVLVGVRVADPTKASVSPTSVLIPAGSTSARVELRGEGRQGYTIVELSAPRYQTTRQEIGVQPGTLLFMGMTTPAVGDTVRVRVKATMYSYDVEYGWGNHGRAVRSAQDISLQASLAAGTQVVKFMDSTGTSEISSVRIEARDTLTHEFLVVGIASGGTSMTAANPNFNQATHSGSVQYPTDVTVTIADGSTSFVPGSVQLAQFGTVAWYNASASVPHNVEFTSTDPAPPANIGNWTLGTVARQFATPGTYTYRCTNHTNMNGTITVIAAPPQ